MTDTAKPFVITPEMRKRVTSGRIIVRRAVIPWPTDKSEVAIHIPADKCSYVPMVDGDQVLAHQIYVSAEVFRELMREILSTSST